MWAKLTARYGEPVWFNLGDRDLDVQLDVLEPVAGSASAMNSSACSSDSTVRRFVMPSPYPPRSRAEAPDRLSRA